jgi:hypothetical protein
MVVANGRLTDKSKLISLFVFILIPSPAINCSTVNGSDNKTGGSDPVPIHIFLSIILTANSPNSRLDGVLPDVDERFVRKITDIN